jgi:hypothetical protein
MAVYRVTQFPRCHFTLKLDAGDLSFGVHAGIGAAGSVNRDSAIIEQRKNPHQFALDGALAVLYLPTVEIRAVILDQ